VSVFLNEAARKIIDETADVAGFLWQRGWAERNAGNISVRMAEEDIAESCSSQQEQLIPLISGQRVKDAWEFGNVDDAPMMMGQSVGLVKDIPTCKEVIERIVAEAKADIEAFVASGR